MVASTNNALTWACLPLRAALEPAIRSGNHDGDQQPERRVPAASAGLVAVLGAAGFDEIGHSQGWCREGCASAACARGSFRHPCGMTATCIVLNGSSCSGKSSIAAVLQEQWPRPLQVTGLDTFLASQSERFFAIDGRVVDGFSWIPTTVDGQPAFDVVPGPLGLGMIKAARAYWAACADAGLDQVIDDVWLVPEQPAKAWQTEPEISTPPAGEARRPDDRAACTLLPCGLHPPSHSHRRFPGARPTGPEPMAG